MNTESSKEQGVGKPKTDVIAKEYPKYEQMPPGLFNLNLKQSAKVKIQKRGVQKDEGTKEQMNAF